MVKAFRLRSAVSLTIQQTRFIRIGLSLGVPYSSLSLLLRFDSLHSDVCTQYYTFVHGFTIPNINLIRQINLFHFTTTQAKSVPDVLCPISYLQLDPIFSFGCSAALPMLSRSLDLQLLLRAVQVATGQLCANNGLFVCNRS